MPDLTGQCVLVVEDEYFIASEMRYAFEEAGAEVLGPVGGVSEALALIARASRIDGAVLDVNLHNQMVYPVADALKDRGVPFVFATGYQHAIIPARYAQVRCYEKPVEPRTVSAALFG